MVLATLVGQGLTFALVLRALRLEPDADDGRVRRIQAQAAALSAAVDRLDEVPRDETVSDERIDALGKALRSRSQRLLEHAEKLESGDPEVSELTTPVGAAVNAVRQEMLDAQREELVRWRDAGRISDADLRQLERRLDVQELSGF
ncbi:MAG: hypothetical protein AAGC46_08340 [Solirubrobacteraceae bacterium]|nr:hypothetical protein [Patulibacter sp.]